MIIDNIRDEECAKCAVSQTCKSVCTMGRGDARANLMVITDAVHNSEDAPGKLMTNYKYDLFYQILERAVGAERNTLYYASLTKCAMPEGRFAEDEEVENCFEYLQDEIRAVNPTCILTLGDQAMRALTGQKGITGKRGEVLTYEDGETRIPVIPTLSPGFVKRKMENSKAILELFAKDIHKAYMISEGVEIEGKQTEWVLVDTLYKVKRLLNYIEEVGRGCADFETEGLDVRVHKPTMLGISFQPGSGWAIPLHHFDTPFTEAEITEIMIMVKERFWENPSVRKMGWNIKFDLKFANWYTPGGVKIRGRVDDGILMHHLLNENIRHKLKGVGPVFFPDFKDWDVDIKKYKWAEVPIDILAPYCVTDTDISLRLVWYFEAELMKEPVLYNLYRNFSAPALLWTLEAEKEGMLIDYDYLQESIDVVTKLIDENEIDLRNYRELKSFVKAENERKKEETLVILNEKLDKALKTLKNPESSQRVVGYKDRISGLKSGKEVLYSAINFASPKQLADLFYGPVGFGFKMPYVRTKRGVFPSTEKDFLVELPDRSGFIDSFIEWRRMAKLRSTYFDGIKERLDANNRLHCEFLIFGTVTGRFSCVDPNLQNIPRKGNDSISKIAERVKKCFIAPEGYVFAQADYSQAELRLVAEFAKEDTMIEAYDENKDLHALTARTLKGMGEKSFDALEPAEYADERYKAKAANFGLIYGMQAKSYQEYAKNKYMVILTEQEAVKSRRDFFKLYSELPRWHRRQIALAQEHGFVRTLFGRKRRLEQIHNLDDYIRSFDERQAINAPIQGSAGEYTGFSGSILKQRLRVFDERVSMVNTVHDSILFYIPIDNVEPVARLIKETMENALTEEYFGFGLDYVSMKVDIEVGDSWGTLEELKL